MPDFSLCRNKTCPLRSGCVRFRAAPGRRQSYINPPIKEGKCAFYWDVATTTVPLLKPDDAEK